MTEEIRAGRVNGARGWSLLLIGLLSASGCFSEVTLAECQVDSDCTAPGFCRCEQGYCFRCEATDTTSPDETVVASGCDAPAGTLVDLRAAAPPAIDDDDGIWIAWRAADEGHLTRIVGRAEERVAELPAQLADPFALVVGQRGRVVAVGASLVSYDPEAGSLVSWAPDGAALRAWPVQVADTTTQDWFVADDVGRVHRLSIGATVSASVVVSDLPSTLFASGAPVQSLLVDDRYLVLTPTTGPAAVVDVVADRLLPTSVDTDGGAAAVLSFGTVVCAQGAELTLLELTPDGVDGKVLPLNGPCLGVVGLGAEVVTAGADALSAWEWLSSGSLRSRWVASNPRASTHVLRTTLSGESAFAVSDANGDVAVYQSVGIAPLAGSGVAKVVCDTPGDVAPVGALVQRADGELFHLLDDGRYYLLNGGLSRPSSGWNRLRGDHRASGRRL